MREAETRFFPCVTIPADKVLLPPDMAIGMKPPGLLGIIIGCGVGKLQCGHWD